MNLKAEEFQFLQDLYNKCLYALSDSSYIKLEDVATLSRLLVELERRHKKANERTRKYIAERRKVDKNYARPKTR